MDNDVNEPVLNAINSQTTAYALIGKPVHHSLSPLLHNTAFHYCRLNCCYLAFEVAQDSLQHTLDGVRALGFGGLNVTSPHKEAVIPYLDKVSPKAELIQSVNTIVNRNGKLAGYSTDGPGFCRFLREDTAAGGAEGQNVLMIGAGGAARAVALALAEEGVNALSVANRTVAKARELINLIGDNTKLKNCRAVSLEEDVLRREMEDANLIINCLAFDEGPFKNVLTGYVSGNDDRNTDDNSGSGGRNKNRADGSRKLSGGTFVDLRYSPEITELMDLFRRGGGQAYNGKGMLLWQAAMAFALFTGGIKAPVDKMRRVIF